MGSNNNVYGSRSLGYIRGDIDIDSGRKRKSLMRLDSESELIEESRFDMDLDFYFFLIISA